ncbi:MAG: hypothetical protein PHT40_04560 [Patescibacteria group bacterium]|nr:hypothetical protein [Patescibacteria group bacterium]
MKQFKDEMPESGRGFVIFTPINREQIYCHACSNKTITRDIFDNALELPLSILVSCVSCGEPAVGLRDGDITDKYWWRYVLPGDVEKEKRRFFSQRKLKPAFAF